MMDYCVKLLDDMLQGFTHNFSWEVMLTTYWYLTFVEMPRYYFMDIYLVFYRTFTWSSRRKKRLRARSLLFTERPLVTVLAPGKNEGSNIYKLVESLREQTYNNFEIVIVDDGSDDSTALICRDLERAGYIDRFLRMGQRGGKASAANVGVKFSRGKYIVHLDADTSLDRDAIENILIPFYYDTRIKAVGGTVKVRNDGDSICASMQAIEYIKTIQVGRLVTDSLGLLHIISGAFGAFERKTLGEIGGWDIGPGLDGDITQKIRKAGYKVHFAENAVAMTNVPVKWRALFKQRQRWSKSLVRFRLRKHSDIFSPNSNFSFSNMVSNLDGILYDLVFNVIWWCYILVLFFEHADRFLEIFAVGYIIRVCMNLGAFAIAMCITERWKEELHLIRFVPLSTFYTGYFLRLARLMAHLKELFTFSSYKDPWNPRAVSDVAQLEKM